MTLHIKKLKKIEILSSNFDVIWDKTNDRGSFSWSKSTITVGCKSMHKDPLYTFSVLSHEIMEAILVGKGCRFESGRTGDNFLFNFSHQEFENAIQLHIQAITKFIQ